MNRCFAVASFWLAGGLCSGLVIAGGCGGELDELDEEMVQERSIALHQEVYNWVPVMEKYFQPQHMIWAMHIMDCESGGNPNAYNGDDPGGGACGLFQHIKSFFPQRATAAGFPGASPFHPEANIAAAAWLLYNGGGKGSWACKFSPFENWNYTPQGGYNPNNYNNYNNNNNPNNYNNNNYLNNGFNNGFGNGGFGSFTGDPCMSPQSCSTGLCISEFKYNFPGGMCTENCTYTPGNLCMDQPGKPVTFCITARTAAGPRGLCLPRCDFEIYPFSGCRMGYICSRPLARFNQYNNWQQVCIPQWAAGKADDSGAMILDGPPLDDEGDLTSGCSISSTSAGPASLLLLLLVVAPLAVRRRLLG